MFVYGRYATGLPIRNYGKTSTVLSWSWRVSFWTGSLGRFLFNQNSGKWNKNFPEKFPQIPETVEVTKCEPFTRTENSVNSRSKVEWYWKLPDPREVVLFIGNYPWKMLFHRPLEAAENFEGCQEMSGQNLWWRLFQRLIVFQQRTKGQNCKIFTRKSQKRLEQKQNQTNLLFRTFRIATQFKPQAGICSSWRSFCSAFSSWYFSSHKLESYSTARTGDLFRLFLEKISLWKFSSHGLEYFSTIVRLELAIFFGFLIVILFEPQAGIL